MLRVRAIDQLLPGTPLAEVWERLVASNPYCGFMQSLHWAAFKRQQGLGILHLVLEDGAGLAGGAIFQVASGPAGGVLLIAPDGPVLPWDDLAAARRALRLLRDAAEAVAARYGAIGLRIEPRLPVDHAATGLLRDWGRAPVDLLPSETLYLDLQHAPSDVLAAMKPKGRYNIGLARRHGVTVRCSHATADLPILYDLLLEASGRAEFFLEPREYFVKLWDTLSSAGLASIIVASLDDVPLAALLLVCYGDRATYFYGGTANRQREAMAGYALQWTAINVARDRGCTTYDFYGYEPHGDPDHLYAGFSRFKRQFGGTPLRFVGAHDFYWTERLADAIVKAFGEIARPVA